MSGVRDDYLLRAVTGLEGGLVANGSTCGVVTGGALGLGLLFDEVIKEKGASAERRVIEAAGSYVRHFEERYGTQLCRERTGVNFHTWSGQLRYFAPGDRMAKCFIHIYGAARHLEGMMRDLPQKQNGSQPGPDQPVHCARRVLEAFRERTGVGCDSVERASCVLDGGVGLTGGVCGALAGAVMAVNLVMGFDVRSMGFWRVLRDFSVGHANLAVKTPLKEAEPFIVGKRLLLAMAEEAGALECRAVAGREFSGWEDFQEHVCGSEKCLALMDLAAARAAEAVEAGGVSR